MDIKERVDRMEIDMSFIFGWMGCMVVSMGRCMFAVAPNRNYEHTLSNESLPERERKTSTIYVYHVVFLRV